MENIVTAIFSVESEAYQAFTQIRQKPYGEGYVVAELAQLKREGDAITVVEACDTAAVTSNDTAAGMAVGALAGILGGPLGVLLGAYTGTVAGAAFDAADTVDSMALLEATAAKLMDGDVAIIGRSPRLTPLSRALTCRSSATLPSTSWTKLTAPSRKLLRTPTSPSRRSVPLARLP